MPGEGSQVIPRDVLQGKFSSSRHHLLQTRIQAIEIGDHSDGAGWDFLEILSKPLLKFCGQDKEMFDIGSVLCQIAWNLPLLDHFPNGIADHGRGHTSPPQANGFNIWCPQGKGLKDMILERDPSRNGAAGNKSTFFGQPSQKSIQETFNLDRGDTPFIHHPPRAHPGTAPRAVDGEEIDFGIGCTLNGPGEVSRAVGSCLEGNVFGSDFPQAFDLSRKELLVHHSQTRMPFELLEIPLPKCLLNNRVFRVWDDDVSPAF